MPSSLAFLELFSMQAKRLWGDDVDVLNLFSSKKIYRLYNKTLLSWQNLPAKPTIHCGVLSQASYTLDMGSKCRILTVWPFKLNVIHNSEIKPTKVSPLMTVEKLHSTFGAAWIKGKKQKNKKKTKTQFKVSFLNTKTPSAKIIS